MIKALQLQIALMRTFWRIKSTFAYKFAVRHYLHAPFLLMSADSQKTRFVCFGWEPHILQIAKSTYFAQVCKAIVLFVPVYVVNVVNRPFSRHPQPRQSVGQSFLVKNSNGPITSACRASSPVAHKIWTTFVVFPHEHAGQGVVIQSKSHMVSNIHDLHLTIRGAA